MKGIKTNQEQNKRSAENWVDIARKFGEKCVAIQHDQQLSADQKLQKQKSLSEEMAKEIQNDLHLSEEDKTTMLNSITSYIEDWSKMHDALKTGSGSESKKLKK